MPYVGHEEGEKLCEQRCVGDGGPLHDVFEDHRVVDAEQVFETGLGVVAQLPQEREASEGAVAAERFGDGDGRLALMAKLAELSEGEGVDVELDVAAAEVGGEFFRKKMGV